MRSTRMMPAGITAPTQIDATAAGKEYHNFYVATEGKYDITLAVDGKTNTNTVTIVTK